MDREPCQSNRKRAEMSALEPKMSMKLDTATLIEVFKNIPLISIGLIMRNTQPKRKLTKLIRR